MNDSPEMELPPSPEDGEIQSKRIFLQGMGKWSGAAITAAVAGSWLGSATEGHASSVWINRGGGWVNRGGSWMNRGGGWVNRGGGGWINRGGGGWVKRRRPRGSWLNRR